MNIGVISVRYARALLKAAIGAKLEDTVYQEMMVLAKSYIDVPRLRFTIDNPMLPKEKKRELLAVALGGKPAQLSSKFSSLLQQLRLLLASFLKHAFSLLLDVGQPL